MMPSRGWKARPAKGLSASCLLYWWCMWCSDLRAGSRGRHAIIQMLAHSAAHDLASPNSEAALENLRNDVQWAV
jgi:hypothetical protein